jgi:hypothetical protein
VRSLSLERRDQADSPDHKCHGTSLCAYRQKPRGKLRSQNLRGLIHRGAILASVSMLLALVTSCIVQSIVHP